MGKTRRSDGGGDEREEVRRRHEVATIGLLVVLIGGGWVWYAWAHDGSGLDTATLATAGLFLFTLLVAWHSFEMFLATLRKHFELQRGLERFDAKVKRLDARLERPARQ